MNADESGNYVCVFAVGEFTVSSTTEVTVRTISIDQSGTVYVLDGSISIAVTVGSAEKLKYSYVYVGEEVVYPKFTIEVGDSHFCTFNTGHWEIAEIRVPKYSSTCVPKLYNV